MIPESWQATELSAVVERPQYGHTAKASHEIEGPRFLRITDIQDSRVDWSSVPSCDVSDEDAEKYALGENDIMFARTGATTGKSFLIRNCPPKAIFASYLIRIRPRSGVDPQFLWYFFHSHAYWRQIMEKQAGIAQPGVNANKLQSLEVVIAPLPEQHRIVAEIEKHFTRLDAAVANLERVRANLKRARASILKAAVEGRLVPTEAALARAEGRDYEPASVLLERILEERKRKHAETNGKKNYKPPAGPDTDGLPELPEGWTWASVEQLSAEGLANGRSVPTRDDGFPVLRLTAMEGGRIDFTQVKGGDWTDQDASSWIVEPEDFFIMRGNGSLHRVGSAAIASNVPHAVAFPDTMIRLRPVRGIVRPEYLLVAWMSPFMRRQIESSARTTAGIYKVNQASVAAYRIPLPPLAEQMRIRSEVERRLSMCDAIEATVGLNLARCSRLRQSILKRAFEGKLVPQDPNDESASELLARIQADAEPIKKSPAKTRTRRGRTRTTA